MTHDETLARIKPILVDHVKAAHAAVDVAINAVRLDDRERIAELERDLAHALAELEETKSLTDLQEELGQTYHERDEARANLAQNAAVTEALRAELAEAKAAGVTHKATFAYVFDKVHTPEEMAKVEAYLREKILAGPEPTPVAEEEQGPWVIRTKLGRYESTSKWKLAAKADDAMTFESKEAAFQHIYGYRPDEWDSHQFPITVITLAEARRIAGAK